MRNNLNLLLPIFIWIAGFLVGFGVGGLIMNFRKNNIVDELMIKLKERGYLQ